MAYALHVTGESVTVKKAEEFSKKYGVKIASGYNGGGWFCFTMKSAANVKEDKKLLKGHFKGALVETRNERNVRLSQQQRPKLVSDFTRAMHLEIATDIINKNPGLSVLEMCKLAGEYNAYYSETHGNLAHLANDYYAVQDLVVYLCNNQQIEE